MKAKAIFLTAIAAMPALALGEDESAACNALLEHGISNTVTYSTEYDFLSVVRDNYCGSSYKTLSASKQASFGLAIKGVPVSFKGNTNDASTQHQEFCRKFESLQTGSGQTRYAASSLYDKAIEAWRDCIAMAIGGTVVRPAITPNQKIVDFTLAVTKGQANFTGVDTTHMSCRMDGQAVGPKEAIALNAVAQSLRCERSSQQLQFGSGTVDFYPEADVKVKTSTGDYRVDLYEMIDGPANDRISRLEAEIAALRAEANEVDGELAGLGVERAGVKLVVDHPAGRVGPEMSCPPGSYVSSVRVSKSVTGKYATDGIANFTITCAPLKKPRP